MKRRSLSAALLGVVLLTGCGLNREAVEIRSYLVVPPAPQTTLVQNPMHLRVAPFDIAPPYDGKPMIYRFSEARFESDFYNEYLVAPRLMLMRQSIEWLRHAGYDAASDRGNGAHLVRAKVTRMYGDFREPQQPRAVLDVLYLVFAPDGEQLVLAREYALAVPIPDRSADSVAQGLGRALGQALAQLHTDLQAEIKTGASAQNEVVTP